jgi:hypothetical protein
MAAGGYPDDPRKGAAITGVPAAADDLVVFHASTTLHGGKLSVSGGACLRHSPGRHGQMRSSAPTRVWTASVSWARSIDATSATVPCAADAPRTIAERPVQLRGSAVARRLLRLAGWRVAFDGLPARQGVVIVYPHTSNWDFIVGVLAKWSIGIPVAFWGKASLFRVPLFGRWLRWLGGVPVGAVHRKAPLPRWRNASCRRARATSSCGWRWRPKAHGAAAMACAVASITWLCRRRCRLGWPALISRAERLRWWTFFTCAATPRPTSRPSRRAWGIIVAAGPSGPHQSA